MFFLEPPVFSNESLNLILGEGLSSLGEELDDSLPLNSFGFNFAFHSIENLTESFLRKAGMSLRISSQSRADGLELRVLANGHKEDSLVNLCTIDGVLGDLLLVNIFNELDLVIRNINFVSWSKVRNFSESTLLLLLHE